ncbi:TonB-dependent siderophore receptor [Pseudomonas sp. X10]
MKFPLSAPRCVSLWLGLSAVVVVAPLAHAATAQAQVFSFAQPSQPLAQALNAFSRTTGQSVVYTLELPALQAPALNGNLSVEQALQQLLGSSGLTWRRIDGRTLTLEPLDESGALNLQATTITSQQDASYQSPPSASIMRGQGAIQDIPQAINVVPAQVIRDQAPRNLDDALANVSGITQGNNFGGTADTVMKRGFGDNRDGSIMRDGMPIVQGRALNASTERVEVLKGPASLLYGIQDPGGVINVVSKRPQLQQYNALTLRGSTYGSGKNGSGGGFDSTGALGDSNLAYRLIVDHEDEDYWRNYGVHRESLVAPSLAWFGEDTQVLLAYEHREFLYPFDRGTAISGRTNHPLDIPATRRLDEPFNDMEGRSDLYRLEVDHQMANDWKLHFGYSFNRETYDASQVRVTGVDDENGTLSRSIDGTHGSMSRDQFATLSLDGSLQVAGMQHDLLLGYDNERRKIYRADLIRQASRSTFSYVDPVYGLEVEGSTVRPSDSDQTDKLRSDSLFFQDAVHLDDHWILVAGARFQKYDQIAGRGRPFQANTNNNDQAWVPHAGLVYKVDEQLSFYGSYTESFKPNSSIAPLTGGLVLDSAIAPEEAKSWELGAKLDMPGALTGTLALFDITKRNVLVANFDTTTGDTLYSNAGEVRSRGVELDLAGQLSERWSVIGSYAFTDAEVTKDPDLKGNRLQNVARHTGSLSAVYDMGTLFGADRLRLGAGARYVGERAGNPTNDFDLPAYTVADVFASYETQLDEHKVRLQLNVKNLFDKTYYSSAVNRYFVAIGDARQVSLSSTLEF